VIIGISPDKPAKLKKFDEKYGLGFMLLADEDHAVADKYGRWVAKKNYGRTYMGVQRSAFLIDRQLHEPARHGNRRSMVRLGSRCHVAVSVSGLRMRTLRHASTASGSSRVPRSALSIRMASSRPRAGR
jgi:hypothetical protein